MSLHRSQLWPRSVLDPGLSVAVQRSTKPPLTSKASNFAYEYGRPWIKIEQLVMRRSSVRIRQGAPAGPG
jgi:hypothetical protein